MQASPSASRKLPEMKGEVCLPNRIACWDSRDPLLSRGVFGDVITNPGLVSLHRIALRDESPDRRTNSGDPNEVNIQSHQKELPVNSLTVKF